MAYKRHTKEQILLKLKEAEDLKQQGQGITNICGKLMITQDTYYSWKKKYYPIKNDADEKLNILREENNKLKDVIVNLIIENIKLKTRENVKCRIQSKSV